MSVTVESQNDTMLRFSVIIIHVNNEALLNLTTVQLKTFKEKQQYTAPCEVIVGWHRSSFQQNAQTQHIFCC